MNAHMCSSIMLCVSATMKFTPYSKYEKVFIWLYSLKEDIISSIFLKLKNNNILALMVKISKISHYDFHRIVPFENIVRLTRPICQNIPTLKFFFRKYTTLGNHRKLLKILGTILYIEVDYIEDCI